MSLLNLKRVVKLLRVVSKSVQNSMWMPIVVQLIVKPYVKSSDSLSRRHRQLPQRVFLLLLALVVGLGVVALVAQLRNDQPRNDQPARTEAVPTIASTPSTDAQRDAAWAALTPAQQRALTPLKASWATMSVDQQQRWLRTTDRFQAMSAQQQSRMHARMEQWARLTPEERTRARLGYRQAASKLSSKQRHDRWEAYQKLRPQQRSQALAASSLQPNAPASVRVEPGATTVLMTQLFRSESIDHAAAQPDGDAYAAGAETQPSPPTVDVQEASGSPASSAAGIMLPAPSLKP